VYKIFIAHCVRKDERQVKKYASFFMVGNFGAVSWSVPFVFCALVPRPKQKAGSQAACKMFNRE
jgi:hypothetical protein